jgi:protein gp37
MSKIEWTIRPGTKSEVLNPTTGCDKISAGCRSCYAEVMHRRLTGMGQVKYQQPFLGHVRYWPDELAKPFKWKKPRTVFLNSMSDIFHKDVTIEAIAEIYAMMFLTPEHTYIVLTKRADRAKEVLTSEEFFDEYAKACNRLHDKYNQRLETWLYFEEELLTMWPLKNVWQGVSIENQEQANIRVPDLLKTPAHIRVLSCEPLIGEIDLRGYLGERCADCLCTTDVCGCIYNLDGEVINTRISWIICGGESGRNARPMHPDWVRAIRDQCAKAGVAFFFKQWGEWVPINQIGSTDGPKQGGYFDEHRAFKTAKGIESTMAKVGKNKSGNTLDGKQHLNFPV